MKSGVDYRFGDIILAEVQYTDTFETKIRPALVLFEDMGNVIVAGITSNLSMKGVLIPKKEGLPKDSIIKINYIFAISERMIKRLISTITEEKKKIIKKELIDKIN